MPRGGSEKHTLVELLASARKRVEKHSMPEPNSGCWLWTAGVNPSGYAHTQMGRGKSITGHRMSYWAFVCDPGKSKVLHRCDVPSCVNPDHLFLGTQKDNIRDMWAKGRAWQQRAI